MLRGVAKVQAPMGSVGQSRARVKFTPACPGEGGLSPTVVIFNICQSD